MRVALAGLGRMGTPIAERLRSAGHEAALFDVDEGACRRLAEAGFDVRSSVAEAASGADACLLSLPDSLAVEAAVCGPGGLLEASPLPPLCVDLTSGLPSATRRLAPLLEERGCVLLDAPLSGGVAGAAAGTLTAMIGGPEEAVERAKPVLSAFASSLRHAGALGAGDCVKALNNTLSAVSLTATSLAVAAAPDAAEAVAAINGGFGRSQNSEVKFPRDVLPGTFAAGFAAGLMLKDVRTACEIAREARCRAPIAEAMASQWAEVVKRVGPGGDFTRVYEVVGQPALPGEAADLALLDAAVAAACLAAAREELAIAEAAGVELERALEIVNSSTGRSEATRHFREGLGIAPERLREGLAHARRLSPHPLWNLAEGGL